MFALFRKRIFRLLVGKLTVLVCNFQSIWNKGNSLELFVEKHKVDVVDGSESHLKHSIKNLEFIPPGFLAKRKDRDDGYGGVLHNLQRLY